MTELLPPIQHLPEIPHSVEFKKLPLPEGRKYVLEERRNNAKELAHAALMVAEERSSSMIDPKTGLPNEKALETELPFVMETSRDQGIPVALVALDVLGLKRTNDSDGHLKGDDLLKSVAKAARGVVREGDVVYRIGGDEFAALLFNYEPDKGQTEEELNASNSERMKSAFVNEAHNLEVPDERHVGLSIGIAILRPEDTPESFFKRADDAETADHKATYAFLREQHIIFEDERRVSP